NDVGTVNAMQNILSDDDYLDSPEVKNDAAFTINGTVTGGKATADDGFDTVGVPDECAVSSDCPGSELCVAPFDPDLGPQGKGPNECVTECVVLMDELRWCLDATACCDPEAECTDRGYCELPGGSSDGGSTDGGSTGGGSGSTG
ncbi:MAG: hypothetical protein AB1Z98_00495, partial [Nannocystaceae bacterium]